MEVIINKDEIKDKEINFIKNLFNSVESKQKGEEKELVKCLDMNQEGNLVVRTKDNIIKEIMSGEVSIRGVKGYV